MKTKQPQTIADLNIDFIFTKESLTYDYFINEFKIRNPKLLNYKIIPNNYVFEFKTETKSYKFNIFVSKQGLYENTLYDLMSQIDREISMYLFDSNIYGVFKLNKFVKSPNISNYFIIDSELILL